MPTKKAVVRSRKPRRQKSPPERHPKRAAARELRPGTEDEEILELIRAGVENFVLEDSTIQEFLRTLQNVTDGKKPFSHPLTKAAFSKIVTEALRKRNLKRSN